MEFIKKLFNKKKLTNGKTVAEFKEETLQRQGREQFRKLYEKGLTIPVVFL